MIFLYNKEITLEELRLLTDIEERVIELVNVNDNGDMFFEFNEYREYC